MESSPNQDRKNLRLVTIFYYIWAGIQALAGLIGLAFMGIGAFLVSSPQVAQTNNPPPPWFGAVFAGMGALVLVTFEAMAALSFLTARFLSRRQRFAFCVVISVVNCLCMPLGTALGVFTILILQRPSVKAVFSDSAQPMNAPLP